jgi:hypothetical protein
MGRRPFLPVFIYCLRASDSKAHGGKLLADLVRIELTNALGRTSIYGISHYCVTDSTSPLSAPLAGPLSATNPRRDLSRAPSHARTGMDFAERLTDSERSGSTGPPWVGV